MSRVAVVLGAGGTIGHAYHAAVLTALVEEIGWDARRADVLVGTSAGSMVTAMLRAGMPPADLINRYAGRPLSLDGAAVVRRGGFGPPRRPPQRRPSPGAMSSPARIAQALRAPWRGSAGSLAAAILPEGRVPMDMMAAPFDNLYGDYWPAAATWIVSVELDTGRRVAFGRAGAPTATMSEAVRASCAIPAFFEPPEIGGKKYIDGGVHSTTNADLVAQLSGDDRPDLVLVSAPMSAARGAGRVGPMAAVRQFARLSLAREVAGLRRRGLPVVVFQPTAAELEVMNADALDPVNFLPVATRVLETTKQRIDRADLAQRLAALI